MQLLRLRLLSAEGGGGALLFRVLLGEEGRLGDIKVESRILFDDVLEIDQNLTLWNLIRLNIGSPCRPRFVLREVNLSVPVKVS